MKKSVCINRYYYLRSLLIVSAICLLGNELHAALIAKMDPHRANQNKYYCEQQ
jgi:hypothetical protein